MSVIADVSNHMDPVEWLKADHKIIRKLLGELTSAAPAARRATLDKLQKILSLHNAIEENLVYPALAKIAQRQPQAMELFHQTAEADILVFTLAHAVSHGEDATFVQTSKTLASAIDEHIEFEETQAFPNLEAASADERQQLAGQIISFKKAIVEPLTVE